MNLTTAVFLVNPQTRAVKATYENGSDAEYVNSAGVKIKAPVFKTLDPAIKVGDICVVPSGTRHGFTTVKVTDVDLTIDFDDKTPVEWIVTKIDLTAHKALLEQEVKLTEEIKAAEMKVRRANLMNALDLSGSIASLPLAAKVEPTA